MAKTIIFSAPPGWGKTRQAEKLRLEFGCTSAVDNWEPARGYTPGALHMTNISPNELQACFNITVPVYGRGWINGKAS